MKPIETTASEHLPAADYLQAEGVMWLATGEVHRDPDHPLTAILERLDATVALADHYAWLEARRPELGERSAFELIEQDDLDPIAELLDSLAAGSTGGR